MSLKDKLEIGLKPDAAYRPDNLPEHQLEQVKRRKRAAKTVSKSVRRTAVAARTRSKTSR